MRDLDDVERENQLRDQGYMDAAAVPVPDGGDDTLREQLAEKLISTPADWPGEERAHEWGLYMIDALLPRIREHVAKAVRAERERVRSLLRDWDDSHDWSDNHCHEGYRLNNDDDCDSDCLHCAAAGIRWMLDHASGSEEADRG